MRKIACLVKIAIALCIAQSVYAVDATKYASANKRFGDWEVIEFAMPKGILYRLATNSLTDDTKHLTFDVGTHKQCVATPGVLIYTGQRYSQYFDEGLVPMSFKMTGVKEQNNDLAKTHMSSKDPIGTLFIELNKLTVDVVRKGQGKGKLAAWVTAGADVPASENIYFSVVGIDKAFKYALDACNENLPH